MKTQRGLLPLVIGVIGLVAVSCQKEEVIAPARTADTTTGAHAIPAQDELYTEANDPTVRLQNEISAEPNIGADLKHIGNAPQVGTWKVNKLFAQVLAQDPAKPMWIRITDDLAGFSGCNQIFGSVQVHGQAIRFENVGTTRMLCPATTDTERQLLDALRATTGFQVSDGRLHLNSARGEVAVFTRVATHPPTIAPDVF